MNIVLAHRNHKLRRAQARWLRAVTTAPCSALIYREVVRQSRLRPVTVYDCGIIHVTTANKVAYGKVPA